MVLVMKIGKHAEAGGDDCMRPVTSCMCAVASGVAAGSCCCVRLRPRPPVGLGSGPPMHHSPSVSCLYISIDARTVYRSIVQQLCNCAQLLHNCTIVEHLCNRASCHHHAGLTHPLVLHGDGKQAQHHPGSNRNSNQQRKQKTIARNSSVQAIPNETTSWCRHLSSSRHGCRWQLLKLVWMFFWHTVCGSGGVYSTSVMLVSQANLNTHWQPI